MEKIINILKNFDIKGELKDIEPYGLGHINSTFLATYENGEERVRYIVQKINNKVELKVLSVH